LIGIKRVEDLNNLSSAIFLTNPGSGGHDFEELREINTSRLIFIDFCKNLIGKFISGSKAYM
jgi:hypothetical protein